MAGGNPRVHCPRGSGARRGRQLEPYSIGNPAADADLWMTTRSPRGRGCGTTPATRSSRMRWRTYPARRGVPDPGLGATAAAGRQGFVAQPNVAPDASYAPIEVLRALERSSDERQCRGARVLTAGHRSFGAAGFCGRLDPVSRVQRLSADATTAELEATTRSGVYLWAGMLAEGDPRPPAWRSSSNRWPPPRPGAASRINRHEHPRDTRRGSARFVAALLPLLVHFRSPTRFKPTATASKPSRSRDNQHYYSDADHACSDLAGSRASTSIDTVSCTFHGPVRAAPPDRARRYVHASGSGRGSDLGRWPLRNSFTTRISGARGRGDLAQLH